MATSPPKTKQSPQTLVLPVSYRMATTSDLPEIVRVYNTSIEGRLATADLAPVTVADRAPWFAAHDPARRPIWVVDGPGGQDEQRSRLVGWLSFSDFYGRAAYNATGELSIYIDPAAHRQGIARALLAEAIYAAPELSIDTLLGFIFDHNEPSLRLFRALGFEQWAHLPRVAKLVDDERGVIIMGRRVAP